jgi:hypothetical protein
LKRELTILLLLLTTSINCYASENLSEKNSGPTVYLDYSFSEEKTNSVQDFMYFVPTISPTPVDSISSPENNQTTKMLSIEKSSDDKSFEALVKFSIQGEGLHVNNYEKRPMILDNLPYVEKGKPLKNLLEYIKFEGDGYASVHVRGTIEDSKEIVQQVDVNFKAGKIKSPVTISLYTVEPVDDIYTHVNCGNRITARVNSLTFKRTTEDEQARMALKIHSLFSANKKERSWARFKALIANFMIPPIRIDNQGNRVMLDFGYALYKNSNTFTFPKAKHLVEHKDNSDGQFSKNSD